MPIYVYKATGEGCEHCADGLECMQSISAEPLEVCPACGGKVQRVPVPFSAGRGNLLADSNLKSHGFQKLRRNDDGGFTREV